MGRCIRKVLCLPSDTVKKTIKKVKASGGTVDRIILGKNVKTIKAKSFAGTNVKLIVVKSKEVE